jgi:putative PIN family toxin of toxin-antitoxin system
MVKFRVVPDTSLILSSYLATNSNSPNKEFIRRWIAGEFDFLYSKDSLIEYGEKLNELNISEKSIDEFFDRLLALGESVFLKTYHERYYPNDPEDVSFLLTAVNGRASHIVSYDEHLLNINNHYDFKICETPEFLKDLRESQSDV